MDGYEFSLEIVRSPAVVALVTAIATSLGTGLCTYFAATHGKEKEWQRSEKTRKEARLYQQRSRQYELLQAMLVRVASLKSIKDEVGSQNTTEITQSYLKLLLDFDTVLPIAQIYASETVYEELLEMSRLIKDVKPYPLKRIQEITQQADRLLLAMRGEIQDMNAEILKSSK